MARVPATLKDLLDRDLYRLYELIFNRFVASQMMPAVFDQTRVDIAAGPFGLKATGSILVFPGFMALYLEGRDEDGGAAPEEGEGKTLPPLTENE